MTVEGIIAREARMKGVCRRMAIGYVGIGLALAAVHIGKGDIYLACQSLGTIAALAAVWGVIKLSGVQMVYSLYAVIEGFLFAAYTLGVACAFYKIVPGYDKLLHMFSGTFTMMLALPLFYTAKANRRVEKSDGPLAALFCLTTALAVAGVWEIGEYAVSLLTEIDPQCVQATGVSDTMKDMIVCALGALAGVPPLMRFYRTGEGGLLYAPTLAYLTRNFAAAADQDTEAEDEEGKAIV